MSIFYFKVHAFTIIVSDIEKIKNNFLKAIILMLSIPVVYLEMIFHP